jgi:glycosyltransferase involved in cell wall biosynthesis
MLSIVISNFNYGRFLRDAIDSALAQTYPGVEVVVVDDGSTDNSGEIIRSYGDKIIPVLKGNGGLASALNAGFAASRGELVIFLDADDMLFPQTAERVAQIWDPDIAKVMYWLDLIDRDGRPRGPSWHHRGVPTAEMRALLRVGPVLPIPASSGVAYSRKALNEVLPMPELRPIGADGYLQFATPFLGEVMTIRERLGFYRIHGGNNWSGGPCLEEVRGRLLGSQMTFDLLNDFAAQKGFSFPADWLLRSPDYVWTRLQSLRMDPATHPYPNDRRFSLMLKGVRSSLSFPRATVRWRLFNALWLTFLGCAPRGAVRAACDFRDVMRGQGLVGRPSVRLLRRLFGSAA